MSSRLRKGRALVAALGISALVFGVAACGGGSDEADLEAGKQAFAACGACHTLADAGTNGSETAGENAGPNLDDAFRASRQVGMDPEQFEGVVRHWIEFAQAPMPRNIVEGKDADNVAAYVAAVAGTSEDSVVRKAAPEPPEAPVPARQEMD